MKYNKKVFFLFIFIIVIFAIGYNLIISIPTNPIKLRYSFFSKKEVKYLTPQGWAFFTKSPRNEDVYVYKVDTVSRINTLIGIKNTQFSQFLGIKRENRLVNAKNHKITESINDSLWFNYRGNIQKFFKDKTNYNKINLLIFNVKKPSLCGTYCVVLREPLPWSWLNLKKAEMPAKIIFINFNCL